MFKVIFHKYVIVKASIKMTVHFKMDKSADKVIKRWTGHKVMNGGHTQNHQEWIMGEKLFSLSLRFCTLQISEFMCRCQTKNKYNCYIEQCGYDTAIHM